MASLGRVLVVDDEPHVAHVVRDALEEFGYTVSIAPSGQEALRLLPEFRPHVVLLDILMPGLPGQAVLEELRRLDPQLPVIVVTGNEDLDIARSMLAAAFDYLPKPFELAVLERVVGAAIAARQG